MSLRWGQLRNILRQSGTNFAALRVAAAPPPGWKGYIYLGGQMLAQYSDGTTYFAHKDHLGSTRVLTRVDKSVYDSMDYLPYGEQIAGDTGTSHKFTGKERDAESGLDYFGARYYTSLSGRFISPDLPFIDQDPGNPQSWNLYSYARSNPLRYIDPTGNLVELVNGQATKYTLDGIELFGDAMGFLQAQEGVEQGLPTSVVSFNAANNQKPAIDIQAGLLLSAVIEVGDSPAAGQAEISASVIDGNGKVISAVEILLRVVRVSENFGETSTRMSTEAAPGVPAKQISETGGTVRPTSAKVELQLVVRAREGTEGFSGSAKIRFSVVDADKRRGTADTKVVQVRSSSHLRNQEALNFAQVARFAISPRPKEAPKQ